TVDNYKNGYYFTLAPLVAKGKVMIGTSGGELGIRGYVAAFDAKDGKQVWKTHTIPGPGEPGHDTWPGETWKTGGVSVWLTAHYEPELKQRAQPARGDHGDLLPGALVGQRLDPARLQPEDAVHLHPGPREPLLHAGGAAKARSLRARETLPGHRPPEDHDELAPGR